MINWRQIVENELKSINLLYVVIDNDKPPPANLVIEQRGIQIGYVMTYLLSRLCNEFKQHTWDVTTPNKIIAKLEDLKYLLEIAFN